MDAQAIKKQALLELGNEHMRAMIEAEKARIRAKKWWHRFVPAITITWRK